MSGEHTPDRTTGGRVGVDPVLEPLRRRGCRRHGAELVADHRHLGGQRPRDHAVGVGGWPERVDAQLVGARRRQEPSELLRAEQTPEADHDLGSGRVGEGLVAHERVERGDDARMVDTNAGGRVGEHRPTERVGQRVDRRSLAVVAAGANARDDDAAATADDGGQLGQRLVGETPRGTLGHGGQLGAFLGQLPDLTQQRFTEGEVQMDRPRSRPAAAHPRVTGQVAPPRRTTRRRGTRLAVPPHGGAVELTLVDGLRCPDPVQLRWPIGGEDQQRHVGLVRLDHRRVELGRCGAAGAQHDRRSSRHQTQAERHERRGALVVVHVQGDSIICEQCDRHRRRAGAGRHDGVRQTEATPLVDERRAVGGGDVPLGRRVGRRFGRSRRRVTARRRSALHERVRGGGNGIGRGQVCHERRSAYGVRW